MRRALQAALLLAAVLAGGAGVPPSLDAPGGLAPDQAPMFVLFTHDDGVDFEARRAILDVTEGRASANGCQVSATMFTLYDPDGWTVCEDVLKLYDKGMEIADHTIHHETLSGAERSYVEDEILGARKRLVECGVPEEDIVGARPPYLNTDVQYREVLWEAGFLYDSSIVEDFKHSVSRGFGNRLWPWDLGYGNPVNCSIANESFPGLWEVPVWRLSNETAGKLPYAMDPGYSYDCECHNDTYSVYDILKANFDEAYAGNRAPFPIFIHIYWLKEGDSQEQLKRFIDYTLTKPDVYYVTVRQLLAWMQNPVPKDQLTPDALGCGNPGGRPGTLADGSGSDGSER
ncbi:hypothetical protein ABPG75_007568 [Micractinium tetrahymenae]